MSSINKNILGNLRVVVVGLGLMGGSLAKALRPYVATLTAVDTNQDSINAALQSDVIDRGTAELSEALPDTNLIILATPVRTILQILYQLPMLCPAGSLVFDLGSTKGEVCAAMDKLPPVFQAIGGHPMCGKERSGFAQADSDLYQNQICALCRTERTTAYIEQIALQIVAAAGGRPLFLPPVLHDELVSLTSHLPYLIASVLMQQAAETAETEENLWAVSASGFRDSSRLSGSSPAVMGDIILTNQTAVLTQLRRYQNLFNELITLIETESDAALINWLEKNQQDYLTYRKYMDSRNV